GLRVRSRAPAAAARAVARGDPRAALHRDHPGADPGRRVGERGRAARGGRGAHRAVVGAARRALGLRLRSRHPGARLRLADVALAILAIDERHDLDAVAVERTVNQADVGGDTDAVAAREALERDGAQARVAPVLGEPVDFLEGVAHHLTVPAPDRLVELVGEDR